MAPSQNRRVEHDWEEFLKTLFALSVGSSIYNHFAILNNGLGNTLGSCLVQLVTWVTKHTDSVDLDSVTVLAVVQLADGLLSV